MCGNIQKVCDSVRTPTHSGMTTFPETNGTCVYLKYKRVFKFQSDY